MSCRLLLGTNFPDSSAPNARKSLMNLCRRDAPDSISVRTLRCCSLSSPKLPSSSSRVYPLKIERGVFNSWAAAVIPIVLRKRISCTSNELFPESVSPSERDSFRYSEVELDTFTNLSRCATSRGEGKLHSVQSRDPVCDAAKLIA